MESPPGKDRRPNRWATLPGFPQATVSSRVGICSVPVNTKNVQFRPKRFCALCSCNVIFLQSKLLTFSVSTKATPKMWYVSPCPWIGPCIQHADWENAANAFSNVIFAGEFRPNRVDWQINILLINIRRDSSTTGALKSPAIRCDTEIIILWIVGVVVREHNICRFPCEGDITWSLNLTLTPTLIISTSRRVAGDFNSAECDSVLRATELDVTA